VNTIARITKTAEPTARLLALVESSLDDDKAEDIVVIDLHGKSSIGDYMVVATGRSQRHVRTITEHLRERIKTDGIHTPSPEGVPQCDWVLVDAGDVIVHVFRPEVRTFYNLEKMWSQVLTGPELSPGAGRAGELTA
jgi:ribosome-associated protein